VLLLCVFFFLFIYYIAPRVEAPFFVLMLDFVVLLVALIGFCLARESGVVDSRVVLVCVFVFLFAVMPLLPSTSVLASVLVLFLADVVEFLLLLLQAEVLLVLDDAGYFLLVRLA